MSAPARSVALVTLGCTRNEVDSEELAGRLAAEGWTLVDDAAEADVAVVNTCGFIEQAKKDSIDAILEANDLRDEGRTQAVVAVGCLAERYGKDLAAELPEGKKSLAFRLTFRAPDRTLKADEASAMREAATDTAAALGFISAIGAIGGFFIPKAFGISLDLTGSPAGAMKVFLIFYIACVIITWAVYGRKRQ